MSKSIKVHLSFSEMQHKKLLERMEKLGFKTVPDYIYALLQEDWVYTRDEMPRKDHLHICVDEFKRIRRYI